jgi:hypothetical protein
MFGLPEYQAVQLAPVYCLDPFQSYMREGGLESCGVRRLFAVCCHVPPPQVTDLLIRMYRDAPANGSTITVQPAVPAPGRTVAVAPAATRREPLLPGLAAALGLLSRRVSSGGVPLPLLSDLRLRLLSLFLNLGLIPPLSLAKSDYAPSHTQLQQALGGLLPAIAAVCDAAHEAGRLQPWLFCLAFWLSTIPSPHTSPQSLCSGLIESVTNAVLLALACLVDASCHKRLM